VYIEQKIKSETEGDKMEFLFGISAIIVAALLILLPTKIRKIKRKPEDDLDRFFPDQDDKNNEQMIR
jgi:hypothetical protein